jgi:hypothetical protein
MGFFYVAGSDFTPGRVFVRLRGRRGLFKDMWATLTSLSPSNRRSLSSHGIASILFSPENSLVPQNVEDRAPVSGLLNPRLIFMQSYPIDE